MRGFSAERRKWASCFKLLSKGRSVNHHKSHAALDFFHRFYLLFLANWEDVSDTG